MSDERHLADRVSNRHRDPLRIGSGTEIVPLMPFKRNSIRSTPANGGPERKPLASHVPWLYSHYMSYRTTYDKRSDYLYARIEGPESYTEAVKFWHDLANLAAKEGFTKFLVVDNVVGSLSTAEHFHLSLIVAELFIGLQVAFVDSKAETFKKNQFGETVVVNRGVLAEVFHSEEEALRWLLKS